MKYLKPQRIATFAGRLFIIMTLLAGMSCEKNKLTDPDSTIVKPPVTEPEYKLIWADEFDGTALNTEKWNYDIGYNLWGNQEQENYQAANVTVAGGNLVLTARKETIGTTPSNYTSGRINTLNKCEFTYGKIEARMKLPRGKGLWPAFWMLGVNMRARGNTPGVSWPACGELDIMETVNSETWISGASHWAKPDGTHTATSNKFTTTPEEYHVYTLIWNKESVKWYLDGEFYNGLWIKDGMASTSEFHLPFNIILNLAVGGEWPGQVIDDTKLPATMLVDYVRVYQEVQK